MVKGGDKEERRTEKENDKFGIQMCLARHVEIVRDQKKNKV